MPIFNAFSEVTSVTERSPAQVSGLRSGDFLVKCQDELVIFQSHEDIENNLKQNDDLSLMCHQTQTKRVSILGQDP